MPRSATDAVDGNLPSGLPPLQPGVHNTRIPPHRAIFGFGKRDRLNGEEEQTPWLSPFVPLVIVCLQSVDFAVTRAGFRLQNLLSIHLDIFPDVCPAISLRMSVLLPLRGAPARQAGFPMVHFASLRGSALNTPNKPRLTQNSDQKNDMGATQRRQSAKSQ
jgi:hypothetical protein